jgi:hypothetical protein
LINYARFYPLEFSCLEFIGLYNQRENYILDVCFYEQFFNLEGNSDLSRMLVITRKHIAYPIVYLILKLALLLFVANATVRKVFIYYGVFEESNVQLYG